MLAWPKGGCLVVGSMCSPIGTAGSLLGASITNLAALQVRALRSHNQSVSPAHPAFPGFRNNWEHLHPFLHVSANRVQAYHE